MIFPSPVTMCLCIGLSSLFLLLPLSFFPYHFSFIELMSQPEIQEFLLSHTHTCTPIHTRTCTYTCMRTHTHIRMHSHVPCNEMRQERCCCTGCQHSGNTRGYSITWGNKTELYTRHPHLDMLLFPKSPIVTNL